MTRRRSPLGGRNRCKLGQRWSEIHKRDIRSLVRVLLLLLLEYRGRQGLWYLYCWWGLMTTEDSVIRQPIGPFLKSLPLEGTCRRSYGIRLAFPWLWDLQGCPSFCFIFGLFSTLVNDLDIIVKYRCDHRHHVSFDDPCSNTFGPANSNVDDALESEIPLPHLHHFLAPALLQDAY